jgi:hypothetical protein
LAACFVPTVSNLLLAKSQATDVAKLVAEAWKNLSTEERKKWDELARIDKARFKTEQALYKGPWKVAAGKRLPKDPTAPKRPMSAFSLFQTNEGVR